MSDSVEDIEVLETSQEVEQQENVTEPVQEELPEETTEETMALPFDFSEQNEVADLLLSMGVDTYHVPTTPYECMTLGLRFGGFVTIVIFVFMFVKWSMSFFGGKWLR